MATELPLPERAVHPFFLQQLVKDKVPTKPTGYLGELKSFEVVRELVKPATFSAKISYVDCLVQGELGMFQPAWAPRGMLANLPGKPPGVGPTTYFVSHAWSYSFSGLVSLVERHYAGLPGTDNGKAYVPVFYWVDFLAVGQHFMGDFKDNPDSDFAGVIFSSKSVLFTLSPLRAPTALTRLWCLFEALTAIQSKGVELEVVLDPQEAKDLGVKAITNLAASIDVRLAQASVVSDRTFIMSVIRSGMGLEAANAILRKALKEALLTGFFERATAANNVDALVPLVQAGAGRGPDNELDVCRVMPYASEQQVVSLLEGLSPHAGNMPRKLVLAGRKAGQDHDEAAYLETAHGPYVFGRPAFSYMPAWAPLLTAVARLLGGLPPLKTSSGAGVGGGGGGGGGGTGRRPSLNGIISGGGANGANGSPVGGGGGGAGGGGGFSGAGSLRRTSVNTSPMKGRSLNGNALSPPRRTSRATLTGTSRNNLFGSSTTSGGGGGRTSLNGYTDDGGGERSVHGGRTSSTIAGDGTDRSVRGGRASTAITADGERSFRAGRTSPVTAADGDRTVKNGRATTAADGNRSVRSLRGSAVVAADGAELSPRGDGGGDGGAAAVTGAIGGGLVELWLRPARISEPRGSFRPAWATPTFEAPEEQTTANGRKDASSEQARRKHRDELQAKAEREYEAGRAAYEARQLAARSTLWSAVGGSGSLTTLGLYDGWLTYDDVAALGKVLQQHRTLKELHLVAMQPDRAYPGGASSLTRDLLAAALGSRVLEVLVLAPPHLTQLNGLDVPAAAAWDLGGCAALRDFTLAPVTLSPRAAKQLADLLAPLPTLREGAVDARRARPRVALPGADYPLPRRFERAERESEEVPTFDESDPAAELAPLLKMLAGSGGGSPRASALAHYIGVLTGPAAAGTLLLARKARLIEKDAGTSMQAYYDEHKDFLAAALQAAPAEYRYGYTQFVLPHVLKE